MYEGERFNSVTHLAGLVLAAASAFLLIQRAYRVHADTLALISCLLFGLGLLAVYASSTLYHSLRGRQKRIWKKADHCAIFLLIAGTYTPLGLIALRGDWGWPLVATVWLIACVGIARELLSGAAAAPSLPLYMVMGWAGVLAAFPIARNLSEPAMFWLLAGMGCYTAGVLFYRNDKRWRHAHGIWHLFVMAGSGAHVMMVWHALAPAE